MSGIRTQDPTHSRAASNINANKQKSFDQQVYKKDVECWFSKFETENFSLTTKGDVPIELRKLLHNLINRVSVDSVSSEYAASDNEMEVNKEEPKNEPIGKGLFKTVSLLTFDPDHLILPSEKVSF